MLHDGRKVRILFMAKENGSSPIVCIYKNTDGSFRTLSDDINADSGDGTFYRLADIDTLRQLTVMRNIATSNKVQTDYHGPRGSIYISYFVKVNIPDLNAERTTIAITR
jgi:hypothetical protein